jgi:hypothetical protein
MKVMIARMQTSYLQGISTQDTKHLFKPKEVLLSLRNPLRLIRMLILKIIKTLQTELQLEQETRFRMIVILL